MTELKTLKDFFPGFKESAKELNKIFKKNGLIPKDYKFEWDINDQQINVGDLRQKAFKWIKELRANQLKLTKHPRQKNWKKANDMLEGQIGWITHFFNITEEDLK